MARIWQKPWTTKGGEKKLAWCVTYYDDMGVRHDKSNKNWSKKDAEK